MGTRLRVAYGLVVFLFFFFVGISMLNVMLKWSRVLVGGLGLDIGKFMLDWAGVAAFSVPISGMFIGLGLILNRVFKFVKGALYIFTLAFIYELVSSVWFSGFYAGEISKLIGPFMVGSIGKLGVALLVFMLFTFLMLALDVEKLIRRVSLPKFSFSLPKLRDKRRAKVEKKIELPSEKKEENLFEPLEKALEESVSREGIKIVEGGGELAQALDVKENNADVEEPVIKKPKEYKLPDVSLLKPWRKERIRVNPKGLEAKALLLEEKLKDFGVQGKVVSIHYGPVVSMFEYKPAPGVKISRIVNLQDDIAVVMKAGSVRVVAPIPGKDTVGIELPNDEREIVYFSELVSSKDFRDSKSPLTFILGKDIFGRPFVTDLRKMPHLLVAGATGSGKSVALNAMICSFLFKATPKEVKLILIDPKMLEFSVYNGVPHLIAPVITDPKRAAGVLSWAVSEMEKRYQLLTDAGVRSIEGYNAKSQDLLPYVVIIIDELADLMMVAGKDVEIQIARLAQKARAAGIHMVLATQRPSVDVITGLIKANFPSRISFKVSSRVDSRTILDSIGAEKLLGNGDMLFLPPGKSDLIRLHGAYISDEEIQAIADFWKSQAEPEYNEEIMSKPVVNGFDNSLDSDYDELFDEAVQFVVRMGYASASMLQRHFKIGYNRAARLIDMMEKKGIVGPAQGSKPREVLKRLPEDEVD